MKSENESSYEDNSESLLLFFLFVDSFFFFFSFVDVSRTDHISRVVADLEPLLSAELEKMEQIESEAGGLPVPCIIEVSNTTIGVEKDV
jgi:hypothetical protein